MGPPVWLPGRLPNSDGLAIDHRGAGPGDRVGISIDLPAKLSSQQVNCQGSRRMGGRCYYGSCADVSCYVLSQLIGPAHVAGNQTHTEAPGVVNTDHRRVYLFAF